ncbi:MAG: hypothetical protein JSV80_10875 [Acidobacteriota bacterium]|nr:MAG: hypothetical protein JSV80_10875 [Acidobacteriota bacterium]
MARAKRKPDLASILRSTVEEIVEKFLGRSGFGEPLVEELKLTKRGVRQLERKVDALAARLERAGTGRRRQKAGMGRPGRPPIHEYCTKSGCRNPHYARGLCSKHYQQQRRASSRRTTRRRRTRS